jgi:hypothetical protein
MGMNEKCSWDDGKRALNIANHGYDFADLQEVFDGDFRLRGRMIASTMASRDTICWPNFGVALSTSHSTRVLAECT